MFIKLKVKSEQKKYNLIQTSKDSFEVWVKEKPENGLANSAVLQLIAEHFKKHVGRVKIVKGTKSPHKIIDIL